MPTTPRPPHPPSPRTRQRAAVPTPQHPEQNANADAGHIGRRAPEDIAREVPPRADRLPPPTS